MSNESNESNMDANETDTASKPKPKLAWKLDTSKDDSIPADATQMTLPGLDERSSVTVDMFARGICLVWVVNTRFSTYRVDTLMAYVNSDKLTTKPDVIAIQDPPTYLAFKFHMLYKTWCRGEDDQEDKLQEMTQQDNPSYYPYRAPYETHKDKAARKARESAKQSGTASTKKLAKVAFLIRNNIYGWEVNEPGPGEPNRGILATLHLETGEGSIAIHNVYNHANKLDVDALLFLCGDEMESHVCVGDFNLHHKLWGGDNLLRVDSKARELVDAMEAMNVPLVCLNEKGAVTWSRGERHTGAGQEAVLDLVLVGDVLVDQVVYKLLTDIPGYTSDHSISSLAIDMNMVRRTGIRYDWKGTDQEAYQNDIEKALERIHLPEHPDKATLCAVTHAVLHDAIRPAIEKHVPTISVFEPESKAFSAVTATRAAKNKAWRHTATVMTQSCRGIFHVAKKARSWGLPRQMDFTPDFVVGSKTFQSKLDKADCYVNSTWTHTRYKGPPKNERPEVATSADLVRTDTNETDLTPSREVGTMGVHAHNIQGESPLCGRKPDFPCPIYVDCDDIGLESPKLVQEDEVRQLLTDAPLRKAFGVDGIAYEAFKICTEVILKHLTWILQGCNDLGCHLPHFKDCITVVIKKPGKPAEQPTSYRPIAILNTIAKFYERLVSNRIKDLIIKHKLLPGLQFGSPGQSTAMAVEYLTNHIYSAWCKDDKVSVLGLDLSGAYDHVDRTELLNYLVELKFPPWLVKVIWSFLSDRRTYVHMPGYEGPEYWIEVGVPQGSPLSSLLFLLYAAPLLKQITCDRTIEVFSYVDDTYIVVRTKTYDENVLKLEKSHNILHQWASQKNLRFSPTKYNVMHFARPGKRHGLDDYRKLPDIEGFRNLAPEQKNKILSPTVKILGVVFDPRLTFEAHVQSIVMKVRQDLAALKRFSGSTWGADVIKRRNLYYGQMLPKILYAAAGWFVFDPTPQPGEAPMYWGLSPVAVKRLESLQTEILLTISKAWKRTVRQLIERELHIIPILHKLHQAAMSHRCQMRSSGFHNILRANRPKDPSHPTHYLYALALSDMEHAYKLTKAQLQKSDSAQYLKFNELWSKDAPRKRWINKYLETRAFLLAGMGWTAWRDSQPASMMSIPAYKGEWGDHKLSLYSNLPPAQSTMLMLMRTGNIGLAANPVYRSALGILSSSCPLCAGVYDKPKIQTVEHMLIHCPSMAAKRSDLFAAAGHRDFDLFMEKDVEYATAWAISSFGLSQFNKIKNKERYQFPRKQEEGKKV
ncbi:Zinc knuckle [Pyrenophora teres f. teres]|uniref:Zinc knuckle n=1 Tax=Pyrenophora teres f. teres TaxID=97479 RepID=A0A6S6VJP2_9PLEO|nr:Zinc knuckle [Pyrenophora teres f. teres]